MRAGADLAVDDFFRNQAAQQDGDFILELRPCCEKAIFGRHLHRVAQGRDASRNDGNLMHGVSPRQQQCRERMADFMMRHPLALRAVQDPLLFFQSRDDAFDRFIKITWADRRAIVSGDRFKLDLRRERDFSSVNVEDRETAFEVQS